MAFPLLPIIFFLPLLAVETSVFADKEINAEDLESPPNCQTPQALGMESGKIANDQLSASSSFDPTSLGPQNGRLQRELGGGAWCPQRQIDANSYEYIQVNLLGTYEIWAVEVQGRYGNGNGREFAEEIMIDYIGPGRENWTRYWAIQGTDEEEGKEEQQISIFPANHDERTAQLVPLVPPLLASSVRLVPYSLHKRTICLRFELYGCQMDGNNNNNIVELELRQRDGIKDENENESSSWSGNKIIEQWRQLEIWKEPGFFYGLLSLAVFLPLFALLLLLLLRHFRQFGSGTTKWPFSFFCSSSSSSSHPLRPSSSWQNVLIPPFPASSSSHHSSSPLPAGISSAKIFSPSFCRFDTVSIGWSSLKKPPQPMIIRGDWNNANGLADCEFDRESTGGQQRQISRSRSATAATTNGSNICTIIGQQQQQPRTIINRHNHQHQMLPHPIPPNSSAKHVGGLVHSRTQPDGSSFAAAMPIQECANANGKQRQRIVTTTRRAKKPMPKPRSTINLQDGDNAGQQQQKNHNQKG